MFVVCLVGVWQRNFEPVVCVCVRYDGLGTIVPSLSYHYECNHYEFQSSTALYSLMMDHI